ncbi:peptidylprolyl isomerase [Acanthopleuribacter pedis]|uniref:peptidylprolyl isomerase n=1 Tax=Acanthopleuribacter pedis TaxID=442870 RepID=A0A8J7QF09_9BACT|nr:peptidylprolyl isomerase [Acanthopleuribacter pedis]MBO1322819.1 peptidylprolyl isomerase [Acanthopleuribacter pedis]
MTCPVFVRLLLGFLLATPPALADDSQRFPIGKPFSASHILITWKGADRAPGHVTRSKAEAKIAAEELLQKLLQQPEQFDFLAKEHSDGPSASSYGYLGGFDRGAMASAFEKAVRKAKDGEIVPKPIRTQFGFHLIRRNPTEPIHYAVRLILFTHRDVSARLKHVPTLGEHLRRTPEEAKALAEQWRTKVTVANFEETANEHSDFKRVDGRFGCFYPGQSAFSTELSHHAAKLALDSISEVVELSTGFAILKRVPVFKGKSSDILISYRGAVGPAENVGRTEAEAKALAEKLAAELAADPKKFEALAKKHSDGVFAFRGGKQVDWFRDTRFAAYERAYLAMKPGEITAQPIATKVGFTIMRRD